MAKLAVLFFAALAFQATFAGSIEKKTSKLNTLREHIQEVSREAVQSIESVRFGDAESAKVLSIRANEYAHDLNTAVYHLNQILYRVEDGQVQESLDRVAHVLSDFAHLVHQAITDEPTNLKNVLKQNIRSLDYQIERLVQLIQFQQEQAEHSDEKVSHHLEKVIEELLDAIHQFQFRGQVHNETHLETRTNLQQYAQQISKVLQRINAYHEGTAHELAHQAHELSHLVGHVIHHLLRELHGSSSEDTGVFQQILNKLGEIRVALDQVIKSHGSNPQTRVEELKNQIRSHVHGLANQIEKLVQVGQSGSHDVDGLVKYVVSDVLTGFQHLQRNLEQLASRYHRGTN